MLILSSITIVKLRLPGIYTYPLFSTKNEEGNLIEISKYTDDEQELAGIIIYGENKKADKALDGLKFHS